MSLYHLIEDMPTADLEELGQQYAALGFKNLAARFDELVEARARTEHAVWDQQYRTSADYEAASAGAYADSLTEELAARLGRLRPQLREPLQAVRSAA